MSNKLTKYELLQDYNTPNMFVPAGTIGVYDSQLLKIKFVHELEDGNLRVWLRHLDEVQDKDWFRPLEPIFLKKGTTITVDGKNFFDIGNSAILKDLSFFGPSNDYNMLILHIERNKYSTPCSRIQ